MQDLEIGKLVNTEMKIQKLVGLLIVIFIIFGAVSIVGFQLFNDISILFVFVEQLDKFLNSTRTTG